MAAYGGFQYWFFKNDTNKDDNTFYNTMKSQFYAPYILQPTLIDNILTQGNSLHTVVISLILFNLLFQWDFWRTSPEKNLVWMQLYKL